MQVIFQSPASNRVSTRSFENKIDYPTRIFKLPGIALYPSTAICAAFRPIIIVVGGPVIEQAMQAATKPDNGLIEPASFTGINRVPELVIVDGFTASTVL